MHGVKRVALFCIMIIVLPTILIITPLYLRHSVFADVAYSVTESDVVAIKDGLSSIFCESHTLKMNSTFHAFQLIDHPILSKKRKHIRLMKSMVLPDDTLEYWGFYLLRGATVSLKVCSRYEGSRILVVRGEKNLRTCGLMDHLERFGATLDRDHKRVKVMFNTPAQEIHDLHDSEHQELKYDPNTAAEETSDVDNIDFYLKQRLYKSKKHSTSKMENRNLQNVAVLSNETETQQNTTKEVNRRRHARKRFFEKQRELYRLQETLNSDEKIDIRVNREKRQIGVLLDGRIEHGGNALNYTPQVSEENSVSSFETNLLTCYDGSILLTQQFEPSHLCDSVHYLETGEHMATVVHEVVSDGYYYYIFYSDNDFVSNDIYSVFDIYKPTYQYTNISKTKECLLSTECKFPISFWSDQTVIVEVPTHDGIQENEDITLVSTCNPRMSIYMIFPLSVMFLILGCAFL